MASCEQALAVQPDHVEALINRGNALFALQQPEDALASYEQALAVRPDSVEALNNRANALLNLKRYEEALAGCDRTLALKPDLAEAFIIRGHALSDLKRPARPWRATTQALAIKPNSANALAARAHTAALSCNWARSADIHGRLRASVDDRVVRRQLQHIRAALHLRRSRRCSEGLRSAIAHARPGPSSNQPRRSGMPARADCGLATCRRTSKLHPVAFLTAGLIEAHDRSFCEVYGFSASADDGSPERKRLVAAFDHMVDVAALSGEALCREIRKAEIDILIDLGGHTKDSRILDLARRPAPIQVSYLGYPGSVGAPFIDYIIADRFVIPADTAQHYTEKVVYLPDCFQANDDKRRISRNVPTRAQCGLPEHGFVFCAFHSSYKLNPEVFDIWMRLLQAVPGSVIWLVAAADAHDNLRREARARGIDPARLVFAGQVPYADHLARQKLADLFIDTWPYNGGTTASDALWAGLPVLTMAGRSYAARMAGSLLHAVGLPELVTHSPQAYEALALRLATGACLARRRASEAGSRHQEHPIVRHEAICAPHRSCLCPDVGVSPERRGSAKLQRAVAR